MNPSGANAYLYAAYAVVWIIHVAYAATLVSRSKRLKREAAELRRR